MASSAQHPFSPHCIVKLPHKWVQLSVCLKGAPGLLGEVDMYEKQSGLQPVSLEKECGGREEKQLVPPRRGDFGLGFEG